jgi:hypothetical protein
VGTRHPLVSRGIQLERKETRLRREAGPPAWAIKAGGTLGSSIPSLRQRQAKGRTTPPFWHSLIDLLTLLSIELARILEEPDERYLQPKREYDFPS